MVPIGCRVVKINFWFSPRWLMVAILQVVKILYMWVQYGPSGLVQAVNDWWDRRPEVAGCQLL